MFKERPDLWLYWLLSTNGNVKSFTTTSFGYAYRFRQLNILIWLSELSTCMLCYSFDVFDCFVHTFGVEHNIPAGLEVSVIVTYV